MFHRKIEIHQNRLRKKQISSYSHQKNWAFSKKSLFIYVHKDTHIHTHKYFKFLIYEYVLSYIQSYLHVPDNKKSEWCLSYDQDTFDKKSKFDQY